VFLYNQNEKIMKKFKYDCVLSSLDANKTNFRGDLLREILNDWYFSELADGDGSPSHFIKFKPDWSGGYISSIRVVKDVVSFARVYMFEELDMYNCGLASVLGYFVKLGLAKMYFRFRYTQVDLVDGVFDKMYPVRDMLITVMSRVSDLLKGSVKVDVYVDKDVSALINNMSVLVLEELPTSVYYRCAIAISLSVIDSRISGSSLYKGYRLDVSRAVSEVSRVLNAIDMLNGVVCGGDESG